MSRFNWKAISSVTSLSVALCGCKMPDAVDLAQTERRGGHESILRQQAAVLGWPSYRDTYLRFLTVWPNNWLVREELADRAAQAGDHALARCEYQMILKGSAKLRHPDFGPLDRWRILNSLGHSCLERQLGEEALGYFQKSHALVQTRDSYFNLARTYVLLQDIAQARHHLELAKQNGLPEEDALEVESKLPSR